MYGDVVAIGTDDVCKLLSTDGVKSISKSYLFLTWIVSYTYLYNVTYIFDYTVHM